MKKRISEIYKEITLLEDKTLRRSFDEHEFNMYIAVGYLPGADPDVLIGRVVQVREEAGAFGSNMILMRTCSGSLHRHENQWFYKVPDNYIEELDSMFTYKDDIGNTYTLGGDDPETGFIIASKVPEGGTTPMREVKKGIDNALENLILP